VSSFWHLEKVVRWLCNSTRSPRPPSIFWGVPPSPQEDPLRCYIGVKKTDTVRVGATESDKQRQVLNRVLSRNDKGIAHFINYLSNPLEQLGKLGLYH